MYSEKGARFHRLKLGLTALIVGEGRDVPSRHCLVCSSRSITPEKVGALLAELGISTEAVEAEMRVLNPNFSFSGDWRVEVDAKCDVQMVDFLAVCYKLLP